MGEKIWIINQHASKPNAAGLTRHFEIAKRLQRYDIETMIIHGSFDLYLKNNDQKLLSNNTPSIHIFDGVSFLTIPTPSYSSNHSIGRIRNMIAFGVRAYRELASGKFGIPDIIIGSTMTLFGAEAALKLTKLFSIPFIYEVRDLWPLTPIEIGGHSKWHPFLLYLDFLDRKLAKSADLIITTARLMKKYYKDRFKIPDSRFLWITNGTNTDQFKTVKIEEKRDASTFDLFYTGSLGLANGLDAIFDQLKNIKGKFPNLRLVLIGDGPNRNHLQQRAQAECLPVTFLNAVPKQELPYFLNNADAFLINVLPSQIYRFGISMNKLADYHAAGKPILFVGDCAENPVLKSGAGIVANKIEEFPKVLEKMMLLPPATRKIMGEKGQKFARENYEWNKLSERLVNAFRNFL